MNSFFGATDFYTEVALGNVPGFSLFQVMGRNPNLVNNNLPQDIWNPGGMIPWQTAGSTLNVSSDSTDDNLPVLFEGLDSAFNEISEELAVTGTTPVSTVKSFIRVNRMTGAGVDSAGYHGSNQGKITARYSGGPGTDIAAVMDVGKGQSQNGFFTIPRGLIGLVRGLNINSNSAQDRAIDIALMVCSNADDVATPYTGGAREVLPFDGLVGAVGKTLGQPVPINQMSDVWLTVTSAGQSMTSCTVSYLVTLVDVARTAYGALEGEFIGAFP